jgi:hypothetical protein
MTLAKIQIRRAPIRATFDTTGSSSWLRKIDSTLATSPRGSRQNNDSPSIIILQLKPDESNAFITLRNRDDIRPTQFENLRDRVMKLEYERSRRNLPTRVRPHALMVFLRSRFTKTRLVEIGPKLADSIRNEDGRSSFRTSPMSGAPGAVLTVSPPEKTDATVPKPVLHSTSLM